MIPMVLLYQESHVVNKQEKRSLIPRIPPRGPNRVLSHTNYLLVVPILVVSA
jgi:hypothetical protein